MENKSFILEFMAVYRSLWKKYPEAKDVSQKINTLRTNYRRELKRISGLENGLEVEAEAPRKRKKSNLSDELIILAAKRLSEPKNEFRAVADKWALKLKKLEETQRMFAEKFINDILFKAQMGGLHRNSMHLSVVSRTSTPVSSARFFQISKNRFHLCIIHQYPIF
ncbi:uncharacterized protein LOC129944895 [Eupeodes corollae]|uniref:uncharacterized protein LOC129944895 n=1 Tax=Eupeodes corollae TaxID=290404 RepID=UPI0024919481|nr:uncharacterized protein LOC129944895 [Eupeodes corollae]